MKLKTLKNLKNLNGQFSEDTLKREAVKWIKKWKKEKKKMKKDEMVYWCYMGRIHALTEFHNIKEEELTEKTEKGKVGE